MEADVSSTPGPTRRVLVVDDEFEMAMVIAEALCERGFDAVALRSGREAMARLRNESFDALVTDLRMPEVDGLQLLRLSRELEPTRPVVVMTGHPAIDTALESSRNGAYHTITKPFRPSALVHLIETALGVQGAPSSS